MKINSTQKRVKAWAIISKEDGELFSAYLERDFATYEMTHYPLFYGGDVIVPCEISYSPPPSKGKEIAEYVDKSRAAMKKWRTQHNKLFKGKPKKRRRV